MKRETIHGREVYVFEDRPSTIMEAFEKTVQNYPEREAIVWNNQRITYLELQKQVHQLASWMTEYGSIKKNDRVALLLGNRPEFIQMFLACAYLGVIVVPLNVRSSKKELLNMIEKAGASMLCAEGDYAEVVEVWQASHPTNSVIMTNEVPLNKPYTLFDHIFEAESSISAYPHIREEDPLYIMFTSGTTGEPKGAVGSHVNVIHSVLNYSQVFQAAEPIRTLIAVPLFHVTGLVGQMFYMIISGGTNVLLKRRYQTGPYLDLIEREKITFLFNVPTIYIMMMSHEEFTSFDLSSIEIMAFGGAPMSPETITALMKALPKSRLHNAYGATETTSPAAIMPRDYPLDKTASVGKAVPTGEFKVIAETGEELPAGEIGELYIKGPMIVHEYWQNQEAVQRSFDQGYWKSGDMAKIDGDGFLYIMDRKKDIINRGGEKVFSAEVENILYGHPDVMEAAIIGVPDDIFGEEVKAYIVPKEGKNPSPSAIQTYMKEHVADYKVPKKIEIIDFLPRNPGGKILKTKLLQLEKQT
ncbi:Acyl-CoA synthetase (AMP-forming)/AMP-acid ligase II [Thalassobacillus cyri]|uniref:Acyl-CoA synthetase (AMP-forming)/AMP-acid ligase II n=1 Tax=Thalassobacillus cyri TaxID=571932 RepID=A0A1H4E1Y4_9BACI|nr:class I adenylate-forming enzyme family protein [Thalassobacillus cyri]SEA79035.1 Acyl-CoA synthetase (AMP-forming)/AMP-acid ligase II [Thalassobacillus cyri]